MRLPPSEGLKVVEGQEQVVLSKLGTGRAISEEVFPKEGLCLHPNSLPRIELQKEKELPQVAAGRSEWSSEVGNVDPEFQNWLIFELLRDSIGFKLWSQIALEIGRREHNLRMSAQMGDLLKSDIGAPLVLGGFEGAKGKNFLKVVVLLKAEQSAYVDVLVVPEVGDGTLSQKDLKGDQGKQDKLHGSQIQSQQCQN